HEDWRGRVADDGGSAPPFDEFWAAGFLEVGAVDEDLVLLQRFRADPERTPLSTPSGKLEIFSTTIAGFGYDDCPGHPTWLEPTEWLGAPIAQRFPLQLIANNPTARLHSQLDVGAFSQSTKVRGREPIRLHPADAARRGIRSGDVVRVFNDRGSCLAGAVVSDAVRPRVVQLSTGAWYDPLDPADPDAMCVRGNPNVLTFDRGHSKLAQGGSGQPALSIELEVPGNVDAEAVGAHPRRLHPALRSDGQPGELDHRVRRQDPDDRGRPTDRQALDGLAHQGRVPDGLEGVIHAGAPG